MGATALLFPKDVWNPILPAPFPGHGKENSSPSHWVWFPAVLQGPEMFQCSSLPKAELLERARALSQDSEGLVLTQCSVSIY